MIFEDFLKIPCNPSIHLFSKLLILCKVVVITCNSVIKLLVLKIILNEYLLTEKVI